MIAKHVTRLRRAVWTWRQPLTRLPSLPGLPVSDLFLWRKGAGWSTHFELIDVAGLFPPEAGQQERAARLVFFDGAGKAIAERELALAPLRRQTIVIDTLLPDVQEGHGSFVVFHPHTPAAITGLGAFLAERGYVSYARQGARLRSYVHGNLDAVALDPASQVEHLAGPGFLSRAYHLQHQLTGPARYELAIVNPSSSVQTFRLEGAIGGRATDSSIAQEVQLQPRAAHLFPVLLNEGESARVTIRSRMVMARPLVFRIQNQGLDVFHG